MVFLVFNALRIRGRGDIIIEEMQNWGIFEKVSCDTYRRKK
jgi:hypothetical protein